MRVLVVTEKALSAVNGWGLCLFLAEDQHKADLCQRLPLTGRGRVGVYYAANKGLVQFH